MKDNTFYNIMRGGGIPQHLDTSLAGILGEENVGSPYEIHGQGEPVVLIAGLNSDHSLYRGILPQLAARYQVVVFDNRGVTSNVRPRKEYFLSFRLDTRR